MASGTLKTSSYPGWDLDLRWTGPPDEPQKWDYPKGIHYNCSGAKSAMILVREVAMMLVMDRLTDKPNWHVKVFDDEIAEKWKAEALAWPDDDLWHRIANIDHDWRYNPDMPKNILSEEAVEYVSELHAALPCRGHSC
jgi:hypothetical protein